MNPNGTLENLRPAWRKGDPSPNPSGRPIRLPITDMYRRIADEPISEAIRKAMKRNGVNLKSGATFAEALATRVWAKALSGDSGAAKEIREAIEGKTGQRVIPKEEEDTQWKVNVIHVGERLDGPARLSPLDTESTSEAKPTYLEPRRRFYDP